MAHSKKQKHKILEIQVIVGMIEGCLGKLYLPIPKRQESMENRLQGKPALSSRDRKGVRMHFQLGAQAKMHYNGAAAD